MSNNDNNNNNHHHHHQSSSNIRYTKIDNTIEMTNKDGENEIDSKLEKGGFAPSGADSTNFDKHSNNNNNNNNNNSRSSNNMYSNKSLSPQLRKNSSVYKEDLHSGSGAIWLGVCFVGIMCSFIVYGLVMEYATSGGRKLHELSLIFVTSSLYTLTAYVGRHIRGERPTDVPKSKMMVLAMTSMGSTYTSVRSLRYVIYPVQVLAKSCKPIPVMFMGAFMGKKYPLKKYIKVGVITGGVAMFMMGKSRKNSGGGEEDMGPASTFIGLTLLFISLCFDGGTGAYEDKLMSTSHVGPFDLMYNIQLGKTILAGIALICLGQINYFIRMCHETGFALVLLGLSGAFGQVFIFVTISKFGALTCSIIGLARKIVTLLASIYIYGHKLNFVQGLGVTIAFGAMIYDFLGGKKKGGGHGGSTTIGPVPTKKVKEVELEKIVLEDPKKKMEEKEAVPLLLDGNDTEEED
jgi:UDP-galactose transporter B1